MSGPEDVFRSCFDLRWHFNPAAASTAGLTTQDRRLGSYDSDSVRAHLAAAKSLASAMEALEVDELETEIDRTALLNDLRATAFRFEHEQPHVRNPGFWLSHLNQAFYALLAREWGEPAGHAEALLERLRGVPAFLEAAAATLDPPAPVLRQTAIAMLGGSAGLVSQAGEVCARAGADSAEEVARVIADAMTALGSLGEALTGDLATGEDEQAFAIGEEQFNRRLHFEHAVNITAPELWRYGLRLVDEVEANLVRLGTEIDPGETWQGLIERFREESPVRGDRVEAYRVAMAGARDFVQERGLVAIPPGDLEVLPMPAFLRPLTPFAAYWAPGAYAPDRTGRFFVNPDAAGSLGRSEHELACTALHEGYPGHHVHALLMQALPSEVRRVVWSPLTMEGWALYCEELMADEGYLEDPAQRLFQQMHLLWRAVRILLDIGLHTRGMSPAAATLFLLDRIPIQPQEAEAEVRRYCASPATNVCYALGWREIRALRDDFRARAGANYSLRGFHDAFMRYGGLPVSYARWGMGL